MPKFAWRPRVVPEYLQVPWGAVDVAIFIGAWIGLQIVIMLLLTSLSSVVPWIGSFMGLIRNGDVNSIFIFNLVDAAIGFGVIGLFLRRYRVGLPTLGFRRVGLLKTIGYLLVIMVFFVVASNALLELVKVLVPGFNPNQAQDNEFIGAAGSHHSLAFVALVILPPILEETIFRGFIFPALSKRIGVAGGAVASSLIFGIFHWQANITIYTFLLGLLLCFMYVRLRSIVPGIFLHMINNYLAFVALTSLR